MDDLKQRGRTVWTPNPHTEARAELDEQKIPREWQAYKMQSKKVRSKEEITDCERENKNSEENRWGGKNSSDTLGEAELTHVAVEVLVRDLSQILLHHVVLVLPSGEVGLLGALESLLDAVRLLLQGETVLGFVRKSVRIVAVLPPGVMEGCTKESVVESPVPRVCRLGAHPVVENRPLLVVAWVSTVVLQVVICKVVSRFLGVAGVAVSLRPLFLTVIILARRRHFSLSLEALLFFFLLN